MLENFKVGARKQKMQRIWLLVNVTRLSQKLPTSPLYKGGQNVY